jgi:nucleoside-diphosphate-sugar epimerase
MAARVATAASARDPAGELLAVGGVTANAIMDLRAEQLVHLSSGSVYETLEGDLSPERVLAPRLPYSIAKLAAELLFASYAEAPYWIVRFFGAFGPGEPEFKLARRALEAFSRGESQFSVRGDGTNVIDPMYIDDAAASLIELLSIAGGGRAGDLTQGEGLTVRQFLEAAYACVAPDPDVPLTLQFEGTTHEKMLGRARSDPAFGTVVRRTIAEGFQAYAAALARR